MSTVAPRTHVDMMRDLLAFMVEHAEDVWPDRLYVGGGEYARGCEKCQASTAYPADKDHAPGCPYTALMAEVRAYLQAEDEQQARDDADHRSPSKWHRDDAQQVAAATAQQRGAAHKLHLIADGHCMADDDGHCTWDGCEQNNPATRKPHCQRDIDTRRRLDPDDEGRAGG